MRCTYEKFIFINEETGYRVLIFTTQDHTVPPAARKYPLKDTLIRFTATGYYLPMTKTIELELEGRWEQTKYGLQLAVENFTEIIPNTKEGIVGFLSSGLIKGIGEKTAGAIVQTFGLNALAVLEKEPAKLLCIKGITEKKLADITSSYEQSKSLRDVVSYMSPFGISVKKAAKIHREFGNRTMEILKTKPFEMCTISGFGFKTVDLIARKTSCSPNDSMRVQGALRYVLAESQFSGHLYLTKEQICEMAYGLLNEDFPSEAVDKKSVVLGLYQLVQSRVLFSENGNIYIPRNFCAERDTAIRVAELLMVQDGGTDVTDELSVFQDATKIILSQKQSDAVKTAFAHQLSIITGGPGTGKTTVLKAVLEVFQKIQPDGKVLLSAPTGRASRRMAESTGYLHVKTLHSALSIVTYGDGDEEYISSSDPIDADLIIVDEVSMVDMQLANELFSRIQNGTRVVLVGDADQLPSVGAGSVFREFIGCGLIPVTVLDMVFRQAQGSRIALNAHAIKQGKTSLLYGPDFFFVTCETAEEAASLTQKYYLKETANGIDEIQILSPFRSRGEASVEKLNETVHELVNPVSQGVPELKVGAHIFRLGDRVLQTKNKGDISNGDVGFIKKVFLGDDNDSTVTIEFSGERVVEYTAEDLDIIELAYALTIHKSQGSEYPTVIMPLLKSFYIMLKRNLLYTAITRARAKVILIGQKSALFTAIHQNDIDQRNTLLGERVRRHYAALCEKRGTEASVTQPIPMK